MLVACVLLATGRPALAHPHVWIDASAEFVFEQDQITAIQVRWLFDDLFSMTLIDEFDRNHDTRFFDAENIAVRDNAFAALADVSWLTHLRRNEELITFAGSSDFKADITEDRRVSYEFTLDLETPLDPVRDQISLSVYDAEYYIDVAFTQMDPVVFAGNQYLSCHFEMTEDEENRIYHDLVAPIRADIRCTAKSTDGPHSGGLAPGDFVLVE